MMNRRSLFKALAACPLFAIGTQQASASDAFGRGFGKDGWLTYLEGEGFPDMDLDTLRDVLGDPHIAGKGYSLRPVPMYPALAITSPPEDGCWYLGYVDLITGNVTIHAERGADDGMNPHRLRSEDFPQFDTPPSSAEVKRSLEGAS
jgi:hypothetical protein